MAPRPAKRGNADVDVDESAWDGLLRRQDSLVSYQQAVAAGWSAAAIKHRVRSGRWTPLLPRVLLVGGGMPTDRQRCRAALLYAGAEAALTGPTACVLRGLRTSSSALIHVTVPAARPHEPVAFVRPRPTIRVPSSVLLDGLRVVSVERAVIDTGLELGSLHDVRALVAEAVQRGIATLPALAQELEAAPVRGSRRLRQAITEMSEGARSAPEAELLAAMKRCRQLPPYELNVDVHDAAGRWLARPDVVFRSLRVIVEVDGMRWHLSPERWAADVERHTRLEAAGWTVLRYTAARVFADARGVVDEIAACLAARQLAA